MQNIIFLTIDMKIFNEFKLVTDFLKFNCIVLIEKIFKLIMYMFLFFLCKF